MYLLVADPALVLPVGALQAPGAPIARVDLSPAVKGLMASLVAAPAVTDLGEATIPGD